MEFIKADNLSDGWHNFSPDMTLPMPEGKNFYVENPKSGIKKLKKSLLRDKTPKTYFVCGHRGSGKSTELNKLAKDEKILDKFTVLLYSFNQICDFATLNYLDFPVSIAIKLKELKKEDGISVLSKKLIKEFDDWFKTVVVEVDQKSGYSVSGDISISSIFAKFKTGVSKQGSWRKHMKQVMEPRLTELLSLLDNGAKEISKKMGKKLLVIIDNMEKADSGKIKEIINNSFTSITSLDFHIIYTLPINLRGDREALIPRDMFYVVSCIKIYKKDEDDFKKIEPEAKALFQKYFSSRMNNSLIEKDAFNMAITFSGGNLREMGKAIQLAIDFAEEAGHEKILKEDMEKVRYEIIKSVQPILRPDDYKLLKKVRETKDWVDGIDFMLQHLIILEYENDNLWIDVRQALIPFIDKKIEETDD